MLRERESAKSTKLCHCSNTNCRPRWSCHIISSADVKCKSFHTWVELSTGVQQQACTESVTFYPNSIWIWLQFGWNDSHRTGCFRPQQPWRAPCSLLLWTRGSRRNYRVPLWAGQHWETHRDKYSFTNTHMNSKYAGEASTWTCKRLNGRKMRDADRQADPLC